MGPPPKRSSAAFDRGGQTGPPRSNAFFSAPLTTQAPPTTVRPDARRHARPDVAPDPNQKPISQILIMGATVNDNSSREFGLHAENEPKTNRKFETFLYWSTIRSFVRLLVRSKIFQILVRADAIDLVQKSSNFEPSSRFFGRLKILNSKRRRNEAFEFDSSCRAPQRALQLESNSNATV